MTAISTNYYNSREGRNPLPKSFFVIVILLMAIILSILAYSRYHSDITSHFNDCFQKNGIKEIFAMAKLTFLRVCELPDGKILAQEIVQEGGEWKIVKTYEADNVSDIPGRLIKVYPYNSPKELFFVYIEELLTLILY